MFCCEPADRTIICGFLLHFSICPMSSDARHHVASGPTIQSVPFARAKSSVDVTKAAAPHEQHNHGSRGQSHEVGSDAYRAGRLRTN